MSDITSYDDVDTLVSVDDEGAGKYFCIDVPDYDDATNLGGTEKESYLRVGAAISDWTAEPGADLLGMAYLTGAAGRVKSGDGGYTLAEADHAVAALTSTYNGIEAADLGDMFIDDQRTRGTGNERPDGAPGHGFSEDDRRAASAKLHTNVGWRDHTDGNRISTTRGDKVEVVYGNYKLVVMGRQTDPTCAQGWEANGDHIQDFADGTMPGASVTVEWVADSSYGSAGDGGSKGAWLLQNSTERVYQYSRNAGNFRNQNWGDLIEEYTGSENPESIGSTDDAGMQGHPTQRDEGLGSTSVPAPSVSSIGLPRGNPKIIERTWATSISSHTGSETLPVPDIANKTWADNIIERTFAGSIDSNVGTFSQPVGSINEATWATTIQSYKVAAFVLEMATGALVINLFSAPRVVVELVASLQITGVLKVEWSLGASWDFKNFHNEATAAKNELNGIRNDINTATNRITAVQSVAINNMNTEIATVRTDLANTTTRVAAAETSIGQNMVRLSNCESDLSALIFMG